MIEGFVVPTDECVVAHRELDVCLRLEFCAEFMTQQELESVLDSPEAKQTVSAAICKLLARAFDQSRTVGWDAEGNKPVELVGITRCQTPYGVMRSPR